MERQAHIPSWLNCAVGLAGVVAVVGVVGWAAPAARGAITIEMVTVGDPGNVGELSGEGSGGVGPPRVCGSVPYIYQIGKYEVTNAQYRQFLNSVARYSDPYVLYKGPMGGPSGGIIRVGSGTISDPYLYVPKDNDPRWDTKPLNYVTWYSSLRFINWLQNGQPVSEAGAGVTETGTYTFSDPSTVPIPDRSALTTPHYALPTEDEWYKPAYYKGGGTAAGYWDYATQSDTLPNNNPPGLDTGNSANYGWRERDPNTGLYVYHATDVGAYGLSVSAYGTFDQNGNVAELLEGLSDQGAALTRGGGYLASREDLGAPWRRSLALAEETGFRVALVPEPGTLSLVGVGWIVLCTAREEKGSGTFS